MTITQNLTRASEYNRAIALIVWSEQHSISVSGGVERHAATVRHTSSESEVCTALTNSGRPTSHREVSKSNPLTDSHSHGNLLLCLLFVIGTLMLFGVAIWRSLPVIWRWL